MKKVLVIVTALCFVVLSLTSCSKKDVVNPVVNPQVDTVLEIHETDVINGSTTISVGQKVKFVIRERTDGGYMLSDPDYSRHFLFTGTKSIPPASNALGAQGSTVYYFTATAPGSAHVHFSARRPWNGEYENIKIFYFTILK